MRKSTIFVKILLPFLVTSIIGVCLALGISNTIVKRNISHIYKDLSNHKTALNYVGETSLKKFVDTYKAMLQVAAYSSDENKESVIRNMTDIAKKATGAFDIGLYEINGNDTVLLNADQ
ncbi:MAG: hypothetical protein Q4E99_05320, partial [Bacillota bacterium]|nr:hypothetical protein [Bacillota bacterium]